MRCQLCGTRPSTRALCNVAHVCSQSARTRCVHTVSVLVRTPTYRRTPRPSVAVNVAAAHTCSVFLLCPLRVILQKTLRVHLSVTLIDSLAGCFHSKFIKHFQRTHFLFLSGTVCFILFLILTDASFSFKVWLVTIFPLPFLMFLSCTNPRQKHRLPRAIMFNYEAVRVKK